MSALITEKQKGAANRLDRDYENSLICLEEAIIYYREMRLYVLTNSNCQPCIHKMQRTKRHAKRIIVK